MSGVARGESGCAQLPLQSHEIRRSQRDLPFNGEERYSVIQSEAWRHIHCISGVYMGCIWSIHIYICMGYVYLYIYMIYIWDKYGIYTG